MDTKEKNSAPVLANAFRITEKDGVVLLDFAYAQNLKKELTDAEVDKVSSIIVQKELLKVISDKINEVINK